MKYYLPERDAASFFDEADSHREMARAFMRHGMRSEAKEWLRLARAAERDARVLEARS